MRDRRMLPYAVVAISIAVIILGGVVLVREWRSGGDETAADTPPVVLTVVAGLDDGE